MMEELKDKAIHHIDSIAEELFEVNRKLYENPEVKFEEFEAVKWLRAKLEEEGFQVEENIGGLNTAFRATFSQSREGPTVGLMAEYDALPKIGHGCGHNLIACASIGAGIAIKKILPQIQGTIQIIGTPGEEGGGGKVILADNGVFDSLDVAMMFHPYNITSLARAELARRKVLIEFKGKPAHAFLHQEEGINALSGTIQTFVNINAVREYIKDYSRIHGVVTHGGEIALTVPDYSASSFYIMAPNEKYCKELYEKVRDCAKAAALTTGAELNFELQGTYKPLMPNLPAAEAFGRNLCLLGVKIDERELTQGLAATDMGDVSELVPTIHPYVCLDKKLRGWHTPEVARATISDKGEKTLLNAAKALAMTAIDIYTSEELLNDINANFDSKMCQLDMLLCDESNQP